MQKHWWDKLLENSAILINLEEKNLANDLMDIKESSKLGETGDLPTIH